MEQNKSEIIDSYLLNTMPDEERKDFEQQLAQDKELGKEVAEQREIIYAVQERGARENTMAIRKRVHTKRILIKTFSIMPIAVAASIMAAVMIVDFNKISNLNNDPQFIAYIDNSYVDMRVSYDSMKGCEDIAEAIMIATEAIEKENYKEADQILEEALLTFEQDFDPTSPQQVEEKEDLLYLQALCTIKQNRTWRAKKLLRQLADTRYAEQAKYMLDKLE